MTPFDYITITTIYGAISVALGWWVKSRLDESVKYEYSKMLELFKAETKRAEILGNERLEAFKVISDKLIKLRRYCDACANAFGSACEFMNFPDTLPEDENIFLLSQYESINREVEKYELFISPSSRKAYNELKISLGLGFNLEIYLQKDNISANELNAVEMYESISAQINNLLDNLYYDLDLPSNIK